MEIAGTAVALKLDRPSVGQEQRMRRYLSGRFFKRLRDSEGANLLETAIITPLLVLLTFAIIDFSALLFVHLALQSGVGQASRYGVTGNVSGALSREDSIRLAMTQASPLTIDPATITFQHLSGGLWVPGAGNPGDIEKVAVDYNWQIMTPLMSAFFTGGQISFHVESAMKDESF
jgi:Flp pilus assembly protein TadG